MAALAAPTQKAPPAAWGIGPAYTSCPGHRARTRAAAASIVSSIISLSLLSALSQALWASRTSTS